MLHPFPWCTVKTWASELKKKNSCKITDISDDWLNTRILYKSICWRRRLHTKKIISQKCDIFLKAIFIHLGSTSGSLEKKWRKAVLRAGWRASEILASMAYATRSAVRNKGQAQKLLYVLCHNLNKSVFVRRAGLGFLLRCYFFISMSTREGGKCTRWPLAKQCVNVPPAGSWRDFRKKEKKCP